MDMTEPGCNCSTKGSEITSCDIRSGNCRCKKHYVGRNCSTCEDGFWDSPTGCEACDCNPTGTNWKSKKCDNNGQCSCKPGVTGKKCDKCLDGYYNFSETGCKQCGKCSKGQICDALIGCSCPPGSYGLECGKCHANHWGHEPEKGCKPCHCSNEGSMRMQCHPQTGQCVCKQGYIGIHCDQCDHGYYGYPKCRRCSCNLAGTDQDLAKCDPGGMCQCNENGECPCKSNVIGKRCNFCKDNSFGMDMNNPDGCTECFCFGRSVKCAEAKLTWGQLRTNSTRVVTVDVSPKYAKEYNLIPGYHGNVSISTKSLKRPLYWQMHPIFRGDRILSYGGYLRFSRESIEDNLHPVEGFNEHPLVILEGNDITLEYYPLFQPVHKRHEVRLHESLWRKTHQRHERVSRLELMVVLQNITNIFIKSTDSRRYEKLILNEVTLDTAIEVPGNPPPHATGVEMCTCPHEYNSTSCQNPSIGFFRYQTKGKPVTGKIIIDDIIGKAKKCECNGRSDVCDIETGYCLNCKNNTDGNFCEKCAEGFYGNPMERNGKCLPCPCPSKAKNFAKSCHPGKGRNFICECKSGYTGPKCDTCAKGYYGQPQTPDGRCIPCNCNEQGSISNECDINGKCRCKPGVLGKQCSQCSQPRYILQNYQCTPCDNCIQWLLDDIDSMSNDLHIKTNHLVNATLQPPWESLKEVEKRYNKLNDDVQAYESNMNKAREFIEKSNLQNMEDRANALNDNIKGLGNLTDTMVRESDQIYTNSKRLLDDIMRAKEKINTAVSSLEDFGQKHIDVKNAVEQGRKYLKEIQKLNRTLPSFDSYPILLEKCERVQKLLDDFDNLLIDPDDLRKELEELKKRLKDLENIIKEVNDDNNLVSMKNSANSMMYDKVKELLKKAQMKFDEVQDLDKINKKIDKIYKLLNDIQRFNEYLDDSKFDENLIELKNSKAVLDEDLSNLKEIVREAGRHTEDLERRANEYTKLFNLTDRELDAVQASEAYGKIVELIEAANKTVKEAESEFAKAMLSIKPLSKDSLYDNSSILFANSTRLQARVKVQLEKINDMKKKIVELKNKISSINSMNWNNGIVNSNHSKQLHIIRDALDKSYMDEVQGKVSKANQISDDMKEAYKKASDINLKVEYELAKRLQKYLNLTSNAKISAIRLQIQETKDLLEDVFLANSTNMDIIRNYNQNYKDFAVKNNTVAEKLAELKARIKSSRDTVDGIKISLSGSDCNRAYRMTSLEPSRITKLLLSFTFKPDDRDNKALFHLGNDRNFMTLYTIEKDLILRMKLGETTYTLKHEELELENFYTVYIERIGRALRFNLNGKQPKRIVIEEKDNEAFSVDSSNLIYVGWVPNEDIIGLPGCIKNIYLNDYNIGLWNFEESHGVCTGCKHNTTTVNTNVNQRFNGEGYSYFTDSQKELTHNIEMKLNIKSFDENALIFLAPYGGNYIALTLKDGKIQFEVQYKKLDPIILTTEKKYNNGNKTYISAKLAFNKPSDTATLSVNGDMLTKSRNANPADILRVRDTVFYFGGVPPQYFLQTSDTRGRLHTHTSILGDIQDVHVTSKTQRIYTLYEGDDKKNFGVEMLEGDLEFTKVSFLGNNGFLNLQLNVVDISSVSFLLRTNQDKTFIMKLNSPTDILFLIDEGRLVVKIKVSDDDDEVILASSLKVNTFEFFIVDLIFNNGEVKLLLDGEGQDFKSMEQIPKNDNEYLILRIGSDISSTQSLRGEVKEIFINSQLVKFNQSTVKTFERARIGRSLPEDNGLFSKKSYTKAFNTIGSMQISMKEMQNTEGCDKNVNYQLDRNAVKFGDLDGSYVVQYVKEQFWKQDFTIEIKFRTFYKNGLIFLARGPKNHFTLLEVYEGKVRLQVSGKRKKVFLLGPMVDDGLWHRIVLQQTAIKKKRKLLISVDGFTEKPKKIPQNRVTKELFIGGVPDNFKPIKDVNLHPFRGCIHQIKMNNITQSLIQENNHHKVGQCFPNIERGSYFRGDSYAIYDRYFRANNYLELNFEFRTAEQNGILLSISNPDNSPAISVELQNGAVVMTVDMGNGIVSNVTNYLSEYALCNNRWHNVSAWLFSELTVNVDGVSKSWVLADMDSRIDELEGPLYIGGIPDQAPTGTLKVHENFKGCIKNIKIGDKIKDWVDMYELNNVSLNSCPVA